jgi:hypothetical protein
MKYAIIAGRTIVPGVPQVRASLRRLLRFTEVVRTGEFSSRPDARSRFSEPATTGKSRRLQMMNCSKPFGPSGSPQAPSPKRRRPRLRASCSPSPQPSPRGEGETFGRRLIIRPGRIVVRLRNEQQIGGNRHRNVRIFPGRGSALPLLGERVGVRGNKANSNPGRTTIPGTAELRAVHELVEPCGTAGRFGI